MRASARERLFAYGTLAYPEVMHAVTGHRRLPGPATVIGFRRVRVRGESFPGLIPDPGGRTDGWLYEGLDEGLLEELDLFEGDLYERHAVAVQSADATLWAATYVVPERHRARLVLEPWDEVRFVREDLAGFVARCRRSRRAVREL